MHASLNNCNGKAWIANIQVVYPQLYVFLLISCNISLEIWQVWKNVSLLKDSEIKVCIQLVPNHQAKKHFSGVERGILC